ncbi:recombinase family protein [Nostoc cycadae]|uniref:DNA invertase n=1 Tax=Nostoc cycadae WK-1 TaxID=1861711 RepID=A0A2H6LC85_9NOSO|nr:recombinase family protein [Nostoc cycadae]GBE90845.1 DNA invertase [Nostoc cycadae WK-1]
MSTRKRVAVNPDAVVIYLRVSTDEQGKSGLGLDAQLDACKRLCEQRQLTIVGVYSEVISGKVDPRERPVFMQALTEAQQHGASLLVSKQDRFSREVFHVSGYVNNYFFGSNTPILIAADSPNASPMEVYLRAVVAEEERKLISKRTKDALAQLKKQGVRLGDKGREAANQAKRDATEEAIQRASELRQQRYTLQAIADTLNTEGFTTSKGTPWTKQALSKRLSVG